MKIGKEISLLEVIELYRDEEWTAHEIAKKYGVVTNTVLIWLEQAGVKRRRPGRKTPNVDPKLLRELYFRKKYSLLDIAKELKTSDATVLRWFRKFNIQRRGRGGKRCKLDQIS